MTEALVSVVMPVYNGAKYLNESIDSILQQTFSDFEFIIINDGSTDNSLEIIKSYNDERIVLINQENQGVATSLNNGIKIAKGEYIARMDADDISYDDRFRIQVNFLKNNPDVIIVGSNADVIDKDGNFVYTTNKPLVNVSLKNKLSLDSPFIHPSVMMGEKVLAKAGLYPNTPIAQDLFLFNRMSNFGNYANIRMPLIKYRLTPGASSRRSSATQNAIDTILKEYLVNKKMNKNQIKLLKKSTDKTTKKEKYYQYHVLLAKKYLWNNYEPKLARKNILLAIQYKWCFIIPYFLFVLSLFPRGIVQFIYKRVKSV